MQDVNKMSKEQLDALSARLAERQKALEAEAAAVRDKALSEIQALAEKAGIAIQVVAPQGERKSGIARSGMPRTPENLKIRHQVRSAAKAEGLPFEVGFCDRLILEGKGYAAIMEALRVAKSLR